MSFDFLIVKSFQFNQVLMLHNNKDCLHKIELVIFTAGKNPVAKFQSPLRISVLH